MTVPFAALRRTLRRVLPLAGLLLLGTTAPAAAQEQGPPTITVEITFDASTGAIDLSQDPIRVQRPGTRVQWTSDAAEWRVRVIRGNRVFGGGNDDDRTFRGGSGQRAGAPVVPSAPDGSFKYVVIVVHDGVEHELDPEIIIAF